MAAEIALPPSLERGPVPDAIDACGRVCTAGDIALRTGLPLAEVERALHALLAVGGGGYVVDHASHAVTFAFPRNYRRALIRARGRRSLRAKWNRYVWPVLFYCMRISVGLLLVLSLVLLTTATAAIAVAAAIAAARGGGGGGGGGGDGGGARRGGRILGTVVGGRGGGIGGRGALVNWRWLRDVFWTALMFEQIFGRGPAHIDDAGGGGSARMRRGMMPRRRSLFFSWRFQQPQYRQRQRQPVRLRDGVLYRGAAALQMEAQRPAPTGGAPEGEGAGGAAAHVHASAEEPPPRSSSHGDLRGGHAGAGAEPFADGEGGARAGTVLRHLHSAGALGDLAALEPLSEARPVRRGDGLSGGAGGGDLETGAPFSGAVAAHAGAVADGGDGGELGYNDEAGEEVEEEEEEIGFLEAVFSFVFGEGPPQPRSQGVWSLIGAVIACNGGVVPSSLLRPYLVGSGIVADDGEGTGFEAGGAAGRRRGACDCNAAQEVARLAHRLRGAGRQGGTNAGGAARGGHASDEDDDTAPLRGSAGAGRGGAAPLSRAAADTAAGSVGLEADTLMPAVVARFGGRPVAHERGFLVYEFPALMHPSAANAAAAAASAMAAASAAAASAGASAPPADDSTAVAVMAPAGLPSRGSVGALARTVAPRPGGPAASAASDSDSSDWVFVSARASQGRGRGGASERDQHSTGTTSPGTSPIADAGDGGDGGGGGGEFGVKRPRGNSGSSAEGGAGEADASDGRGGGGRSVRLRPRGDSASDVDADGDGDIIAAVSRPLSRRDAVALKHALPAQLWEGHWVFTAASPGQVKAALALGVANLLLALLLSPQGMLGAAVADTPMVAADSEASGSSVAGDGSGVRGVLAAHTWAYLLVYAATHLAMPVMLLSTVYLAVPACRYAGIKWLNGRVDERNAVRRECAQSLATAVRAAATEGERHATLARQLKFCEELARGERAAVM